MTIFMVRVRHTPPSRFSSPSRLPLDVAAARGQGSQEEEEVCQHYPEALVMSKPLRIELGTRELQAAPAHP